MRIFIDVDGTLLSSENGVWSLRPGAREMFRQLSGLGHQLYVWSATGKPHAERLVSRYGLGRWVVDCLDKDANPSPKPDLIVDDDGFLVKKYSGICVEPYRQADPTDRELFRVVEALRD